jgi:circadian clock protein KaiB
LEATQRKGNRMRSDIASWKFTLYVAGETSKSKAALNNLKKYCEQYIGGRYTIEVIDLFKEPHRAETDQILAIPTLIRKQPGPIRKIIGDLSNSEKVLQYLDFITFKEKTNNE